MWDSLIPLLILSPVEYQTTIGVTHVSHGPLPLLFLLAFALSWTIRRPLWKYGALIATDFLATYTGFGVLLGFVCPLAILFDSYARRRELALSEKRLAAAAFGLSLLVLGSFFVGHTSADGVCTTQGSANPLHYFLFAAFMFANFVGLRATQALVPSILAGSALVIFVVAAWICAAKCRNQIIPLTLIAYSLLFAFATAHGRICLGLAAALGSRYMIYLTPAFFGIYLLAVETKERFPRTLLLSLLLPIALSGSLWIHAGDQRDMAELSHQRSQWKACYLAEHDLIRCNRATGATVYTYPDTSQSQLYFLEERHLNLFAH